MRKNRGRVIAAIVALAMLLTAVGGAAVGILAASPASAHDQLLSSDPADGAELDEPVGTLTLTFSGQIIPDGTQVRVTTPDAEVDADVAVDGEVVTATFDAPDAGGEHVVQWRAVSADGHPIEGELAYTVAAPAEPDADAEADEAGAAPSADPAPEPSPEASAPVAGGADAAADGGTGTDSTMPLVYGAVLVALIGTAAVLVARSRRRLHESVGPAPGDDRQA